MVWSLVEWPAGPPVDLSPRVARRVLEQQSGQCALRRPQQEQPEQPEQQCGFSCCLFVPHLPVSSTARQGRVSCGRTGCACHSQRASGIVRRPRFADRGEEGKMARVRPVRAVGREPAAGRISKRGAGLGFAPRRPSLPRRSASTLALPAASRREAGRSPRPCDRHGHIDRHSASASDAQGADRSEDAQVRHRPPEGP